MEEGHRGPTRHGARPGGRARPPPSWLGGCPPAVFSMRNILKYSRKKSNLYFRAFGELLFSGYFYIAWIIQITDRNTIFVSFNINNRK